MGDIFIDSIRAGQEGSLGEESTDEGSQGNKAVTLVSACVRA